MVYHYHNYREMAIEFATQSSTFANALLANKTLGNWEEPK